jgi:hypothetical protein
VVGVVDHDRRLWWRTLGGDLFGGGEDEVAGVAPIDDVGDPAGDADGAAQIEAA